MNKFCRQRLKKKLYRKEWINSYHCFLFWLYYWLTHLFFKNYSVLMTYYTFFFHIKVYPISYGSFSKEKYTTFFFFFWLEKSILLHLGVPKYKIYLYLALSFHFMIVGVVHIGGRLVGTVGPIISPCIFGKKIQVKLFSEPLIFSAHLIQIEIWHNS